MYKLAVSVCVVFGDTFTDVVDSCALQHDSVIRLQIPDDLLSAYFGQ